MRWARQPGEPDGPWAAFQNWLHALPRPRRLDDLARIHGDLGYEILEYWAERFDWRDRADAWDDYLDDLRVRTFSAEVVSIAKRQAALACELQEVARTDLGRMRKTQGRLKDAPLLPPREVLRYAIDGMAAERAANGVPEGAAPPTAWDLATLTDEERATLRALVERVTPK